MLEGTCRPQLPQRLMNTVHAPDSFELLEELKFLPASLTWDVTLIERLTLNWTAASNDVENAKSELKLDLIAERTAELPDQRI